MLKITMLKTIWTVLKETVNDYWEDDALSKGAAIAFYTILSLGPVLLICIAIAGLAFGQDAAQGAIVGQLRGMMGEDAAKAIQTMIASAGDRQSGVWATVIGVGTLLVTASGVFGEMQSALNAIWKAQPKGGLSRMVRARAASLGLVATMGFLLLVSLVVAAVLSALGKMLNDMVPGAALLLQVVNFIISFAIVSALFAAIYKILPDRRLQWRDMTVGAVGTAFLFTVGKTLIGLYLGKSSVASSYGAAGALVIVLLWIYYSTQIFLLGAEFTKVWASHHGSAEAFAVRHQGAPVLTPVQSVLAGQVGRQTPWGAYEVAALATLAFAAMRGSRR